MPKCDQRVRSVAGNAGDGVGTFQVSRRTEDRRGEPVRPVALDQVRDDFRGGLGAKLMPLGGQRLSKLSIGLDDPVVDDGQLGIAIEVWMRFVIRRAPMGSPSRAADAAY